MSIIDSIKKMRTPKKEEDDTKVYRCWICGDVFDDPMVYLLHLHLCNMEHGNYDYLMNEEQKEHERESVKAGSQSNS